MDFTLGPELESIRAEAKRLCERFDDDYWSARDEAHEFPWDFYRAFAEQGWLGILVPEAYGGAGLGVLHAGVLLNVVGASAGAQNAASALHLSIFGMGPVIHHGSEELKRRVLPPTATGELHVSFGVTEDDAGTDTSRIRTFARRAGDGFVVSGKKVWNSKAQQAQKILLLARTTPREECKRPLDGMTLFLADLDPKHVEIRPIPKLGRNAVNSNEVYIENLPVAASDVVGEVGRGFYCLLDGLNPERVVIAAESAGIGRRALEVATRIRFYGRLASEKGVPFLLEAAAYDLANLVEAAAGKVAARDALLDVLLSIDHEGAENLLGVRRAQIQLATFFLERGENAPAKRIAADLASERRGLLATAREELERELSPHYWEITDRGSNFSYLAPERRAKLPEFFALVVQASRRPAREE